MCAVCVRGVGGLFCRLLGISVGTDGMLHQGALQAGRKLTRAITMPMWCLQGQNDDLEISGCQQDRASCSLNIVCKI